MKQIADNVRAARATVTSDAIKSFSISENQFNWHTV